MSTLISGALTRLVLENVAIATLAHGSREVDVVVGPVSIPREISIASQTDRNPGIGGSEFYSIQLAMLLSEAGYRVALEVLGALPKLVGVSTVEYDAALDKTAKLRIVNSAMAFTILPELPENQKTILVSHHPHDGWLGPLLEAKLSVIALVNVGRYQFFSNKTKKVKSLWLPAFTPATPLNLAKSGSTGAYRAGHISSFHPSKGFHTIAKGWMRYIKNSQSPPQAKMQVIGADTLYVGGLEKHDPHELPISGSYGARIQKILSRSTPAWTEHVEFEGLVRDSPIGLINNWEVAIFNPLGFAEADPIVVQDAFSVSTPVIAGTLFGLYDYMRYFPELSAHTSYGISKRLGQLDQDPNLRQSVELRVEEMYGQLLNRRRLTEHLWVEGIASLLRGGEINGLDVGRKEPALRYRLVMGVVLLALQNVAGGIIRVAKRIRGSWRTSEAE